MKEPELKKTEFNETQFKEPELGVTVGSGGQAARIMPGRDAGGTAPVLPYLAQVMGRLEHCYGAPLPFDPRTGQFALVPAKGGGWAGDGDTLADFIVAAVAGAFEVGGEVEPGERREVLQEAYGAMRGAIDELHAVVDGLSELFDEEAAANKSGPPLSRVELRQLLGAVNAAVRGAGCDHTLRHTRAYLTEYHYLVEPVADWLRGHGGYCDCELSLNVELNVEQHLARMAAP